MHLFGHDTRNLAPSVARSRKTLSIKTAGLLLGKLEAEIILADCWAHGVVCATSSPRTTPKHEPGSQLGTTRRSQNLALILLSKSSESRGGEALREGATVVGLLLLTEGGVTVNLAVFIGNGSILSILHHDTQVGSVGSDRVVVIVSTN